ncbi:hypothetical protein GE061_002109 [Apolygus lucorum]|uniref:Uncharacterized protein n=1 Tax=Apolygus lucorum TaxID=248454 RepID=A0A6A4JF36_APOLU|nr:hypothetical protein GE061_002109 [Apolygus lucorum]
MDTPCKPSMVLFSVRNGYITTEVLREILWELEPELSEYDLDMMIDEIDADGSGTVDFSEFMEVMTGGDE